MLKKIFILSVVAFYSRPCPLSELLAFFGCASCRKRPSAGASYGMRIRSQQPQKPKRRAFETKESPDSARSSSSWGQDTELHFSGGIVGQKKKNK